MNRTQEAAIEAKLEAERVERVRIKKIAQLEGELSGLRAVLNHFPTDAGKRATERSLVAKLEELRREEA